MHSSPIYVYSPLKTEKLSPELSGGLAVGPHIVALRNNRPARQRMYEFLSEAFNVDGQIQAERILFGIGSLTGAAAREVAEQIGGKEFLRRNPSSQDLYDHAGEKGDQAMVSISLHNMIMNERPGALSVWRIIVGGILQDGAPTILNSHSLWKEIFKRRNTPAWGVAFNDKTTLPFETAFDVIGQLWPKARLILEPALKDEFAALDLASTAQLFLRETKTVVPTTIGTALVMQGVIFTAFDGRRYPHTAAM